MQGAPAPDAGWQDQPRSLSLHRTESSSSPSLMSNLVINQTGTFAGPFLQPDYMCRTLRSLESSPVERRHRESRLRGRVEFAEHAIIDCLSSDVGYRRRRVVPADRSVHPGSSRRSTRPVRLGFSVTSVEHVLRRAPGRPVADADLVDHERSSILGFIVARSRSTSDRHVVFETNSSKRVFVISTPSHLIPHPTVRSA